MRNSMRLMALVMMLMLMAATTSVTRAQGNPYRQAAPVLRPAAQEPRQRQQPRNPTAVPNPVPQPLPRPAPVPVPAQALRADVRATLDQEGRDLLQKFDDYLFDNLEKAYYRLSYAFKDAVKRTMDKCSCDAGTSNPPADSPDTPTS